MFSTNQVKVKESEKIVLLGLAIDNWLTFKDHVVMFCSAIKYRLHALKRIRKYLTLKKAKQLYNAFINSKFNYASVIWMFCCKKHIKIEKIQCKALKSFIIVMNLMMNSPDVAMKFQFIKSTYALWLWKYITV